MMCTDCPQKLLMSVYKGKRDMDFDDYCKAIDKVPKKCRIDFSGMCEPFANKRCADMILYASDHPLALYTTLQGATLEDWEKVKDLNYEVVVIHLPDRNGRSHFRITDDYLRLLSVWDCAAYSCHGDIDERVLPYLHNRGLITAMHDRAGNVEDRPHKSMDIDRPLYCATSGREMNHNVLLPDGTVITCCMDYGMTGIFGNLFEQSYEDVLNSPEAKRMRATLDKGESICRHCYNATYL